MRRRDAPSSRGDGEVKVTVNGDPMDLSDQIKVAGLLGELKLKPELVVVELNLNILKREEYSKTALKNGDRVEIVQIVGGGAQ